jgi:hypothetical protein
MIYGEYLSGRGIDKRLEENKTVYLCYHPLPVPMAARITKYLNKYVRRVLCLIYIFSFYFWSPSLARSYEMIYGEQLSSRGIDKRFEVSYM